MNKFCFAFLGLLALTVHAQAEDSPLSCGLTGEGTIDGKTIICDVLSEPVQITGIILNRGRCTSTEEAVAKDANIKMFENLTNSAEVSRSLLGYKKSYKFGDKAYFFFGDCNLLEYTITINEIDWTWKTTD